MKYFDSGFRLAMMLMLGVGLGYLIAHIPAPTDPSVFWIGNSAAVYVIVPALIGGWLGRPKLSAFGGALVGMGMIVGFYDFWAVFQAQWIDFDLSPSVNPLVPKFMALEHWFGNLLFGHFGNIPWLTIALVVGAVMGYQGYRWVRRSGLSAGVSIAAVLILEPIVYFSGLSRLFAGQPYAWSAGNVAIWATELLVGLACAVYVWRRNRKNAV